jgi:hypothetical protein
LKTAKPAGPDITQLCLRDGPDDHGIVTVDLELMGMTLDEWFDEYDAPHVTALRERVRFHRARLLLDAPALIDTYVELCWANEVVGDVGVLRADQCVKALKLLQDACTKAGMGACARTNWKAVQ